MDSILSLIPGNCKVAFAQAGARPLGFTVWRGAFFMLALQQEKLGPNRKNRGDPARSRVRNS